MAEDYGIDVRIAPSPQNEAAAGQVNRQLEGMERRAERAGDAITAAFRDGFRSATTEAERAAEAERRSMAMAEKAARAAADAAREAARAEREFIAEADGVFAAIKKQGEATDDAAKKSETLARRMSDWVKSKSGVMEVVDAVAKIGLAMETVNKTIALAQVGMGLVAKIADVASGAIDSVLTKSSSPEAIKAFIDAGGLRGAPSWMKAGFEVAASRDSAVDTLKSWTGPGIVEGANAVDKVFDATISGLEDNMVRYRAALDDAARLDAEMVQRVRERDAALNAYAVNYQQGGHSQTIDEFLAGKGGGKSAGRGAVASAPAEDVLSGWDELAGYIRVADSYLTGYVDTMGELAAQQAEAWSFEDQVSGWDEIEGAIAAVTEQAASLFDAMDKGAQPSIDWAKEYADALTGVLGGAFDDLTSNVLDSIAGMEVSWKDWGRSVLEEISKVIIKMLALQAISGGFGAGGGGSGLGQLLWGVVGGGSAPAIGSSARIGSGDTFRAGGAAPIVTERVAPASRGAPEAGMAPQVSVKVINHHDAHRAALDALTTADGERAVLNIITRSRGRLGA